MNRSERRLVRPHDEARWMSSGTRVATFFLQRAGIRTAMLMAMTAWAVRDSRHADRS
jgi:hypothetical protein